MIIDQKKIKVGAYMHTIVKYDEDELKKEGRRVPRYRGMRFWALRKIEKIN